MREKYKEINVNILPDLETIFRSPEEFAAMYDTLYETVVQMLSNTKSNIQFNILNYICKVNNLISAISILF